MPDNPRPDPDHSLLEGVGRKESRKLRARRTKDRRVWFGLGMFGVVGWSVVVPTLLGLALGIWIDRAWISPYSFTLMGLIGGLLTGLMSAWYWVSNEGAVNNQDDEQRKE